MKTLLAYRIEAQKNDWKAYGVKFTHALQAKCFMHMYPLFIIGWPDAHYIISVRHPAGIIQSLEGVDISDDKIVESWMSAVPATTELAKAGATIVVYPDMLLTISKAKKIISSLGLEWTTEASRLMTDSTGKIKDSILPVGTLSRFEQKYPEASKAFKEISKYA